MDDERRIPVSPKHSVILRGDYAAMVDKAPRGDFVVSTLAKRAVGEMPLMSADLVIAGEATREFHPLTQTYPLHFRKTFFPGQLHADPSIEFAHHSRASELLGIAPPLGHTPRTFRSCLVPGRTFARMSPFGVEPEDKNLPIADRLEPASAIGLYKLAEGIFDALVRLHAGGLTHGDAELHNFMIAFSPIEVVPIDFEGSVERSEVTADLFGRRCEADLLPILRDAVFLQCAIGEQVGALADAARARMTSLFRDPGRFERAIDQRTGTPG